MEQIELSYTAIRNVKWYNHFGQHFGICLYKDLDTNIHKIFICKSQKPETTQMSINREMEKQVVAHPYNGTLLSSQRG